MNENHLAKVEAEKPIDVDVFPALDAEMDEMWSFYHDKSHQIWLWWAVDHATNTPLAFTFGTREHKNLDKLLDLLKPFPIGRVYADHNFAYEKRIPSDQLVSGKKNTQKIERDHLTLRTRIKRLCRKTICFSGVFQKALKKVDREGKAKKAQKAPGGQCMGKIGI